MTPLQIKVCTGSDYLSLALKYCDPLNAAMDEYGISKNYKRIASFLAQVGHESGGLQFFHEIWGPTDAQKRYEPPGDLARKLGNIEPGDGWRFRGRGPIQITGRTNYRVIGGYLALDLEHRPELLNDTVNACRSAGAFWRWKGLEVYADSDDFLSMTKAINGGINGLADREHRWAAAKTELGIQ